MANMEQVTKGILYLTLVTVSLVGCSSMRLRYEAQLANRGNQTELVRVEKSYPVGGALKPLCILTAIGLGGSCWYYLVLPTTQQKAQFKMDAQQLVKNELDLGPTDITREKITRVGWYDEKSSVSQNIHEQ